MDIDYNLQFGLREGIIEAVILQAKNNDVKRLCVFGSRARGDYHRTSDVDLAIYGGNVANFSADVEEYVDTLLSFDYVDMNSGIQDELREVIEKEGIVIYEKV